MTACHWLPGVFAAAAIAAAAPAWSLEEVDARALKQYGGTYSTDCRDPAAPRLRAGADALVIEHERRRMTGRNVQAAYSYFGQSPPPNYQVVLLSEVRSGIALGFIVYRDKAGLYIKLDVDPKVAAALGKPLLAATYRRCGEAPKGRGAGPPPATATSSVAEGRPG